MENYLKKRGFFVLINNKYFKTFDMTYIQIISS